MMNIKGVFGLFTLIYIPSLIIAGIVLTYLEIDSMIGLNEIILILVLSRVSYLFTKKNKQYFTDSEKTKVIIGLIIIDLLTQTLLSATAIISNEAGFSYSSLLTATGLGIAIHGLIIWFLIGRMHKMLVKDGVIEK
jgi:hypothetical protein